MKQSCGSGAEFVDRGQQELQKRIRRAFDFAHRLFRHLALALHQNGADSGMLHPPSVELRTGEDEEALPRLDVWFLGKRMRTRSAFQLTIGHRSRR
jgi:hypothetical protein